METVKMGKDAANGVKVTFFVAECMEFLRYGEYVEEIPTIKEALEYYEKIPSDRLNAGKGIGIHVHDPEEEGYVQEYQLLDGRTMDIDILQMMYGVEKYPQVMEAARVLNCKFFFPEKAQSPQIKISNCKLKETINSIFL